MKRTAVDDPTSPQFSATQPAPEQPGTLFEQLAAVAIYLSNPLRHMNPSTAWTWARWRAMPHAREDSGQ